MGIGAARIGAEFVSFPEPLTFLSLDALWSSINLPSPFSLETRFGLSLKFREGPYTEGKPLAEAVILKALLSLGVKVGDPLTQNLHLPHTPHKPSSLVPPNGPKPRARHSLTNT